MTKDKITDIGIPYKDPGEMTCMLAINNDKYGSPCWRGHQYKIDPEAEKVTCKNCPKTFNPMAVLVDLAKEESIWAMNRRSYIDEMERLSARSKTKCDYCGKMTRISST